MSIEAALAAPNGGYARGYERGLFTLRDSWRLRAVHCLMRLIWLKSVACGTQASARFSPSQVRESGAGT